MKKGLMPLLMVLALLLPRAAAAQADAPMEESPPITLSSPSCILTEAGTGRVIFEKNADERRPVASVTKIMTILLTLEAIDEGRVDADDSVLVSPRASGMGGSQVFLDANRSYRLSDLLKSVIVASANDAAVALAEHLCGAEEAFVRRMNERAAELGLTNTHYVNCTGLPAEGHYTTARDVARLSAQLDRHPLYYTFSTIWMDELRHSSGRITQLTNTNRLVRFYPGCDGYKTGSTNEARYCMSATAKKGEQLGMDVPVKLGAEDSVSAVSGGTCSLLVRRGDTADISLEVALVERVSAPVRVGNVLGEIRVKQGDAVVATIPALAGRTVELPGMIGSLLRIRDRFMPGAAGD